MTALTRILALITWFMAASCLYGDIAVVGKPVFRGPMGSFDAHRRQELAQKNFKERTNEVCCSGGWMCGSLLGIRNCCEPMPQDSNLAACNKDTGDCLSWWIRCDDHRDYPHCCSLPVTGTIALTVDTARFVFWRIPNFLLMAASKHLWTAACYTCHGEKVTSTEGVRWSNRHKAWDPALMSARSMVYDDVETGEGAPFVDNREFWQDITPRQRAALVLFLNLVDLNIQTAGDERTIHVHNHFQLHWSAAGEEEELNSQLKLAYWDLRQHHFTHEEIFLGLSRLLRLVNDNHLVGDFSLPLIADDTQLGLYSLLEALAAGDDGH